MSFLANFVQHVISKTSKSETCHFKEDFLSTCQTPCQNQKSAIGNILRETRKVVPWNITNLTIRNQPQKNSCFKNQTSQSEEENIDFLQFVRKNFYHICQTQNFGGREDFFFTIFWTNFILMLPEVNHLLFYFFPTKPT